MRVYPLPLQYSSDCGHTQCKIWLKCPTRSKQIAIIKDISCTMQCELVWLVLEDNPLLDWQSCLFSVDTTDHCRTTWNKPHLIGMQEIFVLINPVIWLVVLNDCTYWCMCFTHLVVQWNNLYISQQRGGGVWVGTIFKYSVGSLLVWSQNTFCLLAPQKWLPQALALFVEGPRFFMS